MPTNARPIQSTRLENLSLGPDGARLDLEGRSLAFKGEDHAPAIAALQTFYQCALADYHAQLPRRERPSLFARVKSWAGSLFRREPSPIPDESLPSRLPNPAQKISPGTSAKATAKAEKRTSAPAPVLRAAYADKEGVHLIWGNSSEKEPRSTIQMTYRLDSQVARCLQDCYGQLGKLGYEVAGLELLQPGPEKPASRRTRAPGRQPEPGSAAPARATQAEIPVKAPAKDGPEPEP